MAKNSVMKYRAVCPICGKAFDTRKEGFLEPGTNRLICADCYNKINKHNSCAPIHTEDSKGRLREIHW